VPAVTSPSCNSVVDLHSPCDLHHMIPSSLSTSFGAASFKASSIIYHVWWVHASNNELVDKNAINKKDQIELISPPFNSISQVRFSASHPDHLLVSAWYILSWCSISWKEGKRLTRIYYIWHMMILDCVVLRCCCKRAKCEIRPLSSSTGMCFREGTRAFSGGLDNGVRECTPIPQFTFVSPLTHVHMTGC